MLTLQETDPTAATYGIWPWLLEEPLAAMAPPDWNWADFCGARLAQALTAHAAALPADLARDVRAGLGHAAWSIFRRNVGPGYTNIVIMGAAVTLAAGEILGEPRLTDYGRRRLRRIVEHTAFHGGLTEYNSPTYTPVALRQCELILALVRDPAARADAETLRGVAWGTIADHFHPGTEQWAGPHSRAYGDRLAPATARFLADGTGVAIRAHPAVGGVPGLPSPHERPCPPELVGRFRALPDDPLEVRRRFIRRELEEDSVWGTTWLTADACLGSVNYDALWTQRRPLLGYWRTEDDPAVVLRLRFLHDGRDFASATVRNAQRGPRVLSAFGLATNLGDFHLSLDRPADGAFAAEDFRIRYELTGAGVNAGALAEGRYELAAGSRRAVIHTLPGRFGPHAVVWELGRSDGRVWLDGVCYRGPRRSFDPAALGGVAIVAGLEVLRADEAPCASPPRLEPDGAKFTARWPLDSVGVADGDLRLSAPLLAAAHPRGA